MNRKDSFYIVIVALVAILIFVWTTRESSGTTLAQCIELGSPEVTKSTKECFDNLSTEEFANLLDNEEAHELYTESYEKFGEVDPSYDPSVWDDA